MTVAESVPQADTQSVCIIRITVDNISTDSVARASEPVVVCQSGHNVCRDYHFPLYGVLI